ncbi:MAG: PKD domain-containing protein, partial [Bacteroidetes bacterium]|nr:PKD domain-containing protein [Bacteroidota bacterium]
DSAGVYEVSLTLNASNFCVVSTAQNVEIFDPPTAKFTFSNPCVNEFITFTDNSKSDDEVIAWEWDFDGIAQAFSEEVEFKFPQSGEYQVSLIVTTQSGCVDTVSQSIEVFDFPSSSFIASPTTGGSPLLVEFTNTSSGAINYLWQFDDSGQSSDLENPSFTYTEIGKQMVTLVTTNGENCSDTSFFNIEVVLPQVDLAIEQLNTIINENKIQLVLTITNNGTVVIDSMDVAIDVENQVSLSELLISPLAPNETINYPLNFEISRNSNLELSFICVSISHLGFDLEDIRLVDNRECINLEDQVVTLEPFPNPVKNKLSIPIIVPIPNPIEIYLLSSQGNLVLFENFTQTKMGLNQLELDLSGINQGLYFIRIRYKGNQSIFRVFKQ